MVYVLATVGMTRLVFVQRKLPGVPAWQMVIPVAAIVVLGYPLYRNVYPYPYHPPPQGNGHKPPASGPPAVAIQGALVDLPGKTSITTGMIMGRRR